MNRKVRCKRWSTVACATLALAVMSVASCGGAQKRDHYGATISKQRACCDQLSDPNERGSCIDRIVEVDDPEVAQSEVNQATFACMERHFTCDPSTGEATAASKQAQLDCINDL